jgi:hypothetical protein
LIFYWSTVPAESNADKKTVNYVCPNRLSNERKMGGSWKKMMEFGSVSVASSHAFGVTLLEGRRPAP